MTVYHIDKYYDENGEIYYSPLPYNLYGTFLLYYGFHLKPLRWVMSWHPWYYRYIGFFKWLWHTKRTEEQANKLSEKLNKKEEKKRRNK